MYGGRAMSDSPSVINTSSLGIILEGSEPCHPCQGYTDHMISIGDLQDSATEPQFIHDYQSMDYDDSFFFNGTNGTNLTAFIPENLKYINRTQLIAYSLLFPFAAIGNLVVFVALFRNRHRKSRVNMMIMHLSLADMIVTFVFLPTEITWHVSIEWMFGNVGCKVYKFLSAFGFYMSSMVLVCISLDRYFAVLHPLKVNDAQRRGKIMLFFAWIISSVISLPQAVIFNVQLHPNIPDFYQCVTFGFFDSNNGGEMMYTIFCISFLYFIPLLIIIIAYTRIILEITKKSRDTKPEDFSREERYHGRLHLRRSNMSNIERARTRTLRMTFIIVMAFIWCWTPYALGTLWNFIDRETFNSMNQQLQDILFIIAVSNSVVNPFIYGRYSIGYCRGLWNKAGDFCCYCCCCCCPCFTHQRIPTTHPPNANSCKSNGHFNAASGNTRSTIYNNSARDKVVVGVRLQNCILSRYRQLKSDFYDDPKTNSVTLDDSTNSESLCPKAVKTDPRRVRTTSHEATADAGAVAEEREKGNDKKIGEEAEGISRRKMQMARNLGSKPEMNDKNRTSVEGIRLLVISCEEESSSRRSSSVSPKKGTRKQGDGFVILEPVKESLDGGKGEMEDDEEEDVRSGKEKKECRSGSGKVTRGSSFNLAPRAEYKQETSMEAVRNSPATKGRLIKEVLEVQVTQDGDFVCRKMPEQHKKK